MIVRPEERTQQSKSNRPRFLCFIVFLVVLISWTVKLSAQTAADAALEDPVMSAAFNGMLQQFNCPGLERLPTVYRQFYELVPESSELDTRRQILGRFLCGPLSMDVTLGHRSNQDFFPGDFANLVRIDVRHTDLPLVLGEIEDVDSASIDFDAFRENAMASAILNGLNDVSPDGCTPDSWVVVARDTAKVRDVSGVPSHEVRTAINCGAYPDDASCWAYYQFAGRFFPTKAYLFLESVQLMMVCA